MTTRSDRARIRDQGPYYEFNAHADEFDSWLHGTRDPRVAIYDVLGVLASSSWNANPIPPHAFLAAKARAIELMRILDETVVVLGKVAWRSDGARLTCSLDTRGAGATRAADDDFQTPME